MKLADVFQNGAVLQQKKPIVVWGTDDNGRYVKAVLSGEEPREARAEIKDGKFVLTFAPMQAQKEARLVLENDLGEKIMENHIEKTCCQAFFLTTGFSSYQ